MASADVLVVEDAPEFAQLVTAVLRDAGHRVRTATTIAAALDEISAQAPEVIILDLGLPDGDGLDLCRTIRDRSSAYILVVSGRHDELDKLLGFKLGADDYVTKPFSPRELAARVEALLRRPRAADPTATVRRLGDLCVDPLARRVTVADAVVELTRVEFDLLETLTRSPDMVLTRQTLLDRVWGDDWVGDDHLLDVHIANLRRKIDADGAPSRIRTVRGVGYSMAR